MTSPFDTAEPRDAYAEGRRRAAYRRASDLLAACAMLLGLLVLIVGWTLGGGVARSVIPGFVHMAPLTAAGLIAGSVALLCQGRGRPVILRWCGRVLAVLVALLGTVVLAEYITGWGTGIDRLMFAQALAATDVVRPGLPAPNTALCFLLSGLALLSLGFEAGRSRRSSEWLSLIVAFITMQALIGYSYGAEPLYRISPFSPIALHTALGLLLLALATLFSRPDRGLVGRLSAEDAGGFVARRLLPIAILVPVLFGWLRLWGEQHGLYGLEVGTALLAVSSVFLVGAAVWASALEIGRLDERRRAAARALLERDAQLRRAIEFAPFPMMIHADDGSVLQLSHAWTAVTGYTIEDMPTVEEWTRQAHGERAGEALRHIRRLYGSEESSAEEGEWLIRTRSGESRVLDFRSAPLGKLDDGRRLILSAAADMTISRETQAELLRINTRQHFLSEAAKRLLASDDPRALVRALFAELAQLVNLDVYLHFVVDEDSGGLRLDSSSGISDSDAEHLDWLPLRRGVDDGGDHAAQGPGIEGVQHAADELTGAIRGLGITAWVSHPLVARGELIGTLSFGSRRAHRFAGADLELLQAVADQIAIALERRRSYESQRRARRAAEEASRAKDQFLAVMSHELRTPLNAVIGYSDLLESAVHGTLTDGQLRYVERIRQSANNLAHVIEEILTFARVQAQKEDTRVEEADIVRLAREAIALVEPEADRKNVAIETCLPSEALVVRTDPGKFRRILLNLLGNAVKFTDDGHVELRMHARDGSIIVEVLDTGPGIPAGDLDRIFEPFVQADQSQTRTKSGTGLGLTITRELARLLGGDVEVRSEPGAGSTFTVRLPIEFPDVAATR